MGNVVISPNIKKESIRIDSSGNEINPRTKKVINRDPLPYIPPPPHILEAWRKEAQEKREQEVAPTSPTSTFNFCPNCAFKLK